MKFTHIFYAAITLTFLVVAGCGVRDNTSQPRPATLTTSPFVNTPSLILVPTDQPAQTPTLTLIPMLSEQKAFETFTGLIMKDSECNLPCWLGVTPGQTDFEEVEGIFSQFSAIAYTDFTSEWSVIRVFFPNFETSIHETTTEAAPADNGSVSRILVHAIAYQNRSGPRNYNNVEFQSLWQRFFLPGIFTQYGSPEKVFLDTTRLAVDPAASYPFVLWIVYPQKGFLIRYEGINSKIGDNIRICPLQSGIQIRIWDTEELSYEEFIKDDGVLARPFGLGPQPITDVTDFSISSFYEKYRAGKMDSCFETPASIWPH